MFRHVAFCLCFSAALVAAASAQAQQATLLVDVDHRPQISLDGPWHYIPDPYREGWGSNPDHASPNGYAKNAHYVPGGPLGSIRLQPVTYPECPRRLELPKRSLFYYEGLLWYQRDFTYHPNRTRMSSCTSAPSTMQLRSSSTASTSAITKADLLPSTVTSLVS